MAIGLSIVGSSQALFGPVAKPNSFVGPVSFLCRPLHRRLPVFRSKSRRKTLTICVVLEEREFSGFESQTHTSSTPSTSGKDEDAIVNRLSTENGDRQISDRHVSDKLARKKSERFTYLVAAVMSSFGITSMAIMAVYYRFYWQMEGREAPDYQLQKCWERLLCPLELLWGWSSGRDGHTELYGMLLCGTCMSLTTSPGKDLLS